MADFNVVIPWLIYQEDDHRVPGKIKDLHDGDGLTRFGITSKWFSSQVPADFFTTMAFGPAVQAAKVVYYNNYWNHLHGYELDEQIAAPMLSFAVNDNIGASVRALQRALSVHDDGVLGPTTLSEAKSKDPVIVARLFRAEWAQFYHNDVQMNPSKAQFLDGWLNRVNFSFPNPLVGSLYG